MTRRDYGSVRRLPSGRWQARYATPAGERTTAPETFGTRAEAVAYLAKTQTDIDRGSWLDPVASTQTFGEYATAWLADRADLRPRTIELYTGLMARHLIPQLGDVGLARVTTAGVRQWYAARLRAGVGRSTVAKAYRLLKTILNTAVADEVIARNPCVLRGAGAERTPERIPPTLVEAHASAEAIEPRWRMLVLLATWSGLRWGELVALRRGSLHLDQARLTVADQLLETQHERHLGPPKTDAGRRTVYLPPHLVPELLAHVDRWVGPGPDAWLFCGPLGAPVARRNFTGHWTRARAEAGLPQVRFHDLRHLSATLAAATGATTRELMARMGHSSPGQRSHLSARNRRSRPSRGCRDVRLRRRRVRARRLHCSAGDTLALIPPGRIVSRATRPRPRVRVMTGHRHGTPSGSIGRAAPQQDHEEVAALTLLALGDGDNLSCRHRAGASQVDPQRREVAWADEDATRKPAIDDTARPSLSDLSHPRDQCHRWHRLRPRPWRSANPSPRRNRRPNRRRHLRSAPQPMLGDGRILAGEGSAERDALS